jgi:GntR family transcriptional repressor for pyruvate dehydrogenase complex
MAKSRRTFTRSRLSVEVADHLQELILQGELQPGTRLESESGFAERFGISRLTIREAITTLIGRGLVERLGNRTYVSRNYAGVIGQSTLSRLILRQPLSAELYEARRVIEREIAGLAAIRATEVDIAALKAALDALRAVVGSGTFDIVDQDQQFHTAMAKAARNRILQEITGLLKELVTATNRLVTQVPNIVGVAIRNHERLLKAIIDRDPERARRVAEDNLKEVEALYVGHLESQGILVDTRGIPAGSSFADGNQHNKTDRTAR